VTRLEQPLELEGQRHENLGDFVFGYCMQKLVTLHLSNWDLTILQLTPIDLCVQQTIFIHEKLGLILDTYIFNTLKIHSFCTYDVQKIMYTKKLWNHGLTFNNIQQDSNSLLY